MLGEDYQQPRQLSREARKELAILACSADRLELQLVATRARRRDEDLAGKYPRAWPWLKLLEDLSGKFGDAGGSSGPLSWFAALKPLIGMFKASV